LVGAIPGRPQASAGRHGSRPWDRRGAGEQRSDPGASDVQRINAGGRDEPGPVADRAATRAAIALLLAVIQNDQAKAEPLTRTNQRAVYWLMKQCADDGGWPTALQQDVNSREVQRIIRLDNSDYRDSTFAMLLASSVMPDRVVNVASGRCVQKLLALRLEGRLDESADPAVARVASRLWSSAYRMDGSLDPKLKQFPAAADVLASRYAMQTLLGAYLISGEKPVGMALDSTAQALVELRGQDQVWRRAYLASPTTSPSTTQESPGFFDPPSTMDLGPSATGRFGLDAPLESIRQLKQLGRARYGQMLATQFTTSQHLAAVVCGLTDSPANLDLPVTKSEVPEYLKQHATEFDGLNASVPDDLAGRVKRLWLLLVRAKLERMLES